MSPKENVEKLRMHRTQLFIPVEMQKSLAEEAKSLGISNSELVRQIISQYLNRNYRYQTESGMKILLEMSESGGKGK